MVTHILYIVFFRQILVFFHSILTKTMEGFQNKVNKIKLRWKVS